MKCRECGHDALEHVMDEDHARAGDCEHPLAEGGFCRCTGFVLEYPRPGDPIPEGF